MTLDSSIAEIPIPDDAAAIEGGGIRAWATRVGTVEELTAWYRDYMSGHGWHLAESYSVMDPNDGEANDLGYATRAIYCPMGQDRSPIAVNIGWPLGDHAGSTVVLAITVAPQPFDCV